MPDTYTHEDFSVDVLPRGVSKTDRDTISRAVEIGWKLMVTNRGHMTIIGPPPNDHVKFNITQSRSKGRGEGPVKQVRRKIEQLADPELLAIADGKPEPEGTAGVQTLNPVISPDVAAAVIAKMDEPLEIEPEQDLLHRGQPVFAEDVLPKRHIIREEPMVAHAGDRRGYVSDTTLQRWWSDGTTDFKCAQPDCEFTSESRRGVGNHWRTHVRAGEAEPWEGKQITLVTDHEAVPRDGYAPRAERITDLAASLKALIESGLDWSDVDAAAQRLAEEALHWDHRKTVERSALASEREPMSAEQVLDRIRSMVDGGLYLRQQQEMNQVMAELVVLRDRVSVAEADAEKARGTLRAFRELAAEAEE